MMNKTSKKYKPKIMVSSSVYGFQNELTQICALLGRWKYEVWNSHIGTIKVDPALTNMENCIRAAQECDLILGVIRTNCGTGNIDGKNITFEEMKAAVAMNKPYWFLAHHDVVFARQLLKKIESIKNPLSVISKDKKFFDPLCIEMYNFAIKEGDSGKKPGNWVQEFFRFDDIASFLKTQFKGKASVMELLNKEVK
jgi:hypothetical protein